MDLVELNEQLETALREGKPTRPIRAKIAAAERVIAEDQAVQKRAELVQQHAEQQRAAVATAEAVSTHIATLNSAFAGLNASLPPELAPLVMEASPSYVTATGDLVRARANLDAAAAEHQDATATVREWSDRIAGLEARRREIGERRVRGEARHDDAAEVSLIDLDLGELRTHEAAAANYVLHTSQAVADARGEVERAAATVRAVEQQIALAALLAMQHRALGLAGQMSAILTEQLPKADATVRFALLPATVDIAGTLDALMLDAARHVGVAASEGTRPARPAWGASEALRYELRRLAAARNEL